MITNKKTVTEFRKLGLSLTAELVPSDTRILMTFIDVIDTPTSWESVKDTFFTNYRDFNIKREEAYQKLSILWEKINVMVELTAKEGSILNQTQVAAERCVTGFKVRYAEELQTGFQQAVDQALVKEKLGQAKDKLSDLIKNIDKLILIIDDFIKNGISLHDLNVSMGDSVDPVLVTIESDFIGTVDEIEFEWTADGHIEIDSSAAEARANFQALAFDETTDEERLMRFQAERFFNQDWDDTVKNLKEMLPFGLGSRSISKSAEKEDYWESDHKKAQRLSINLGMLLGLVKIARAKVSADLEGNTETFNLRKRKYLSLCADQTRDPQSISTKELQRYENWLNDNDPFPQQQELTSLNLVYNYYYAEYQDFRNKLMTDPGLYCGTVIIDEGPLVLLHTNVKSLLKQVLYLKVNFSDFSPAKMMTDLEQSVPDTEEVVENSTHQLTSFSSFFDGSEEIISAIKETIDEHLLQARVGQDFGDNTQQRLALQTVDAITESIAHSLSVESQQETIQFMNQSQAHIDFITLAHSDFDRKFNGISASLQELLYPLKQNADLILSSAPLMVSGVILSGEDSEETIQQLESCRNEIQRDTLELDAKVAHYKSKSAKKYMKALKGVKAELSKAEALFRQVENGFLAPALVDAHRVALQKLKVDTKNSERLSMSNISKAKDIITDKWFGKNVKERLIELMKKMRESIKESNILEAPFAYIPSYDQSASFKSQKKNKKGKTQLFKNQDFNFLLRIKNIDEAGEIVMNSFEEYPGNITYKYFDCIQASEVLFQRKQQKAANWLKDSNLNAEISRLETLMGHNANIPLRSVEDEIRSVIINRRSEEGIGMDVGQIQALIGRTQKEALDYANSMLKGAQGMAVAASANKSKALTAGVEMFIELGIVVGRLFVSSGADVLAWIKLFKLIIKLAIFIKNLFLGLMDNLKALSGKMLKLSGGLKTAMQNTGDERTALQTAKDFIKNSYLKDKVHQSLAETKAMLHSAQCNFLQLRTEVERVLNYGEDIKEKIKEKLNESNPNDPLTEEQMSSLRNGISKMSECEGSLYNLLPMATDAASLLTPGRILIDKTERDLKTFDELCTTLIPPQGVMSRLLFRQSNKAILKVSSTAIGADIFGKDFLPYEKEIEVAKALGESCEPIFETISSLFV